VERAETRAERDETPRVWSEPSPAAAAATTAAAAEQSRLRSALRRRSGG